MARMAEAAADVQVTVRVCRGELAQHQVHHRPAESHDPAEQVELEHRSPGGRRAGASLLQTKTVAWATAPVKAGSSARSTCAGPCASGLSARSAYAQLWR